MMNNNRMDGDLSQFKKYYLDLKSCCLRDDDVPLINDAVELIYFVESERDGDSGVAVTRQADGTFATFGECQDYTGHG